MEIQSTMFGYSVLYFRTPSKSHIAICSPNYERIFILKIYFYKCRMPIRKRDSEELIAQRLKPIPDDMPHFLPLYYVE